MEISFLFFENKANDFFDEKETQTHFFSESFLGERSEVFLCFSSVGEKMEKKKTRRLILTITPCSIGGQFLLGGTPFFSCFIKTYCSEDRA